MEIVVLVKKVPDPNLPESFVSVSPAGDAIDLHASSQSAINPYDLNAIEAAVTLKEAHGGTVTVLTADDAAADNYLRRAVSLGADRAIRVDLPREHRDNPRAVAAALSEGFTMIGASDLVLAGRAASDTDAGLVPYLLAARLGLPALGPIIALESVTAEGLVAGKLSDTSTDRYAIRFPALLLVSNEINKPRTPSIKGVMASKKAAIEVVAAPSTTVSGPNASFAVKPARNQAGAAVLKDVSDDEKAAAVLAALGY